MYQPPQTLSQLIHKVQVAWNKVPQVDINYIFWIIWFSKFNPLFTKLSHEGCKMLTNKFHERFLQPSSGNSFCLQFLIDGSGSHPSKWTKHQIEYFEEFSHKPLCELGILLTLLLDNPRAAECLMNALVIVGQRFSQLPHFLALFLFEDG